MSLLYIALYIGVAAGFSCFYGIKATAIFLDPSPTNKPLAWQFHQFWLNFTGCVVGWIALWFFGSKVITCIQTACTSRVDIWDVGLFFLAFVGVTGYLPAMVVGLVFSIGALVGKIAGMQK